MGVKQKNAKHKKTFLSPPFLTDTTDVHANSSSCLPFLSSFSLTPCRTLGETPPPLTHTRTLVSRTAVSCFPTPPTPPAGPPARPPAGTCLANEDAPFPPPPLPSHHAPLPEHSDLTQLPFTSPPPPPFPPPTPYSCCCLLHVTPMQKSHPDVARDPHPPIPLPSPPLCDCQTFLFPKKTENPLPPPNFLRPPPTSGGKRKTGATFVFSYRRKRESDTTFAHNKNTKKAALPSHSHTHTHPLLYVVSLEPTL